MFIQQHFSRPQTMFKKQRHHPIFFTTPYSSIYLVLFLNLMVMSGCAQQFSADQNDTSLDLQGSWLGATCTTAQTPKGNVTAAAEDWEICQPEVWGAADKVVSINQLFISSQPDADTFVIAREKGVKTVINLRQPNEFDWDEKKVANQEGLSYFNIPINATGKSFDPHTIDQISTLVTQHKDQKILLHCSSGNRASAWLALYLANEHSMPIEKSISLAKQVGLTSPVIENRVKQFMLDSQPQ